MLNFCANNYLGLADHPDIIAAAKAAMDDRGFGMASVRFICGTQDLHLALEERVSKFLGTEDTILFSSCFDANGGVFESLFGPEDAVISDALNHASIIDGIRLCKAQRFRYANRDMADLEAKLIEATTQENPARRKIIVTDGVFSMDGYLAPLEAICDLAEKYDALVMVDDSHAVGFMGATGAGTPEHAGVSDRVDIYTGTFGKALGGASGGYVSGRARSRRHAPPEGPPVPVLQLAGPGHRRGHAQGPGPRGELRRTAQQALRQRRTLPPPHDRGRLRAARRRTRHCPGHVRRRRDGRQGGRRHAAPTASSSRRSATRWCPRVLPGSASSSPPRTAPTTSKACVQAFVRSRAAVAG